MLSRWPCNGNTDIQISKAQSPSTHESRHFCFTDVSVHMCALLSAYVRLYLHVPREAVHARLETCECLHVMPACENTRQHSLLSHKGRLS